MQLLSMRILLPALTCVILFSCIDKIPKTKIASRPTYTNNIREYLNTAAAAITDSSMTAFHTLKEWENARPKRYDEFLEMMGIENLMKANSRSDLNIKVTGVVQKDGYRIEKLYFESLSHLYVRANLYIPDSITTPRPAILYVSGHAIDQKGKYQGHPAKFAKLGFVCMLTETIQFGEVRGDHWGTARRGWFNWISRGYNPAGVEVWNSVRALDLLSARKDVDSTKIGVTGISGGGSQSWYMAAADPRIKAAAPVCGAGTLKAQIGDRMVDGQCDCMMLSNTYLRDFNDIGALIAPKPFLIAQADQDGMFPIESVRELYGQVKKTYDLYGKPENVSFIETPGPHSYHQLSRENIFSFFLNHLMNKKVTPTEAGDIDTSAAAMATPDELKVYVNGAPKDDRTTTIQNDFIALSTAPVIETKEQLVIHRDSVKQFLRDKTFRAFPATTDSFASVHEFKSLADEHSGNDIYSFTSEKGWRLKVDVQWKNDRDKKKPLMIVLRNYDESRWQSEAFAGNISADWNVAYFEPRGIGENGWEPALQWNIRRSAWWTGRTIASMQVYDLLRCIEFCRTLPNIDSTQIGIAAENSLAVVGLYAALMDGKCTRVMLQNPPATQDVTGEEYGKGPAIEMLNCLQATDVNRLPALIWPAKVEYVGQMPEAYRWSAKVVQMLKAYNPHL